ncbi:MAG: ADP-glyceromanno-heptose 6-epimerase [Solirubrobacteraceae bacterium]|nr:ADP-glyceromanno-heptose 6-epimerase [Solirubrobacteraceae bacterium]
MSGQLVLVTGGAGFIGSNIATDLAEQGLRVAICDRFGDGKNWQYVAKSLMYDLVRPEDIFDWLASHRGQVDGIIHMGAISATTETDVDKIIANNVRLTLDLWTYAATHDTTFIYASSAATYGDGSRGFVDDDSPQGLARLRPLNAYGWSKHLVDRRIVDDVQRGEPTPSRWAGLKFFNVFGPNEAHKGSMRSVVHQMYPVAAAGDPVRLFRSDHPDYADGGQLRDFIYVKDCTAVVRNMLEAQTLTGIYNVGTGTARSFDDLATSTFVAAGREPRIEYIDMPEALRGRYQYFTQADTTKLQAAGLAPAFHTLEDGVRDYVQEHLVHEFAG